MSPRRCFSGLQRARIWPRRRRRTATPARSRVSALGSGSGSGFGSRGAPSRPRQARGGQVQVAAQEGGGGGAAARPPRLRCSARNVGPVPSGWYVCINIVSLRPAACISNFTLQTASLALSCPGDLDSPRVGRSPAAACFPTRLLRLWGCALWIVAAAPHLYGSPGAGET